jgi:heat shock protein HslJ
MMCPEPVMQQENEYLTALQASTSYQVEENVLTMFHPGGTLLFEGRQTR